jgi:quinol monooxygenase YgiN
MEHFFASIPLHKHVAALAGAALLLFALNASGQNGIQHPETNPAVNSAKEEPRMSLEELVIFARFHALAGKEDALAAELRDVVARVRVEPGCIFIEAYRSVRDPRLFWLHARWTDEAAFDRHAALPATNHFVERTEQLIDHPFDVTRTQVLH